MCLSVIVQPGHIPYPEAPKDETLWLPFLLLQASFLDSVSNMAVHGMFKSPSKTYIQLKVKDENIKVMLAIIC